MTTVLFALTGACATLSRSEQARRRPDNVQKSARFAVHEEVVTASGAGSAAGSPPNDEFLHPLGTPVGTGFDDSTNAGSARDAISTMDVGGVGQLQDNLAQAGSGFVNGVSGVTGAISGVLANVHLPGSQDTGSQSIPQCSFMEDGITYPGNDLRTVPAVESPDGCCYECTQDPECYAWVWGRTPGKSTYGNCYLKTIKPRKVVSRVQDDDFVAGTAIGVGRALDVRDPQAGASLFCWSLVIPGSYEPAMIQMQYDHEASIFQCDEMAIYSNQALTVAPGVKSVVVDADLSCEYGGEFGTALNTDIFMKVWDVVIGGQRHKLHDWTAKVDPDAVFFPIRLRVLVSAYHERPEGVYLNNCDMGLHGPLEVFSRNAVNQWASGMPQCVAHFNELCSGPCKWGEDMFVDQCMDKVLHVHRQFDSRLLVEDHCNPPEGWRRCETSGYVAFHPFKSESEFLTCMSTSKQFAGAM